MRVFDLAVYSSVFLLVISFVYIIFTYVSGLKSSPREIYLIFFTKITEYSAYGAINLSFVLYLSKDMGLNDIQAGTFMGFYSTFLTLLVILVGPFCDSIGIKKTLLTGAVALLISRVLMPFMPNLPMAVIFGFFPMAFGIAITGPVISVGIKKFTTKETAALGFGLFYTLMNVGWAIGASIFDSIRSALGEHQSYDIFSFSGISLPFSVELSTYQIIILLGFLINIPDFIAIMMMRDGVELTDEGNIIIRSRTIVDIGKSFAASLINVVKSTAYETWRKLADVFREKKFWIFILTLFMTVFVRIVFEHFNLTLPKYGIRLLGEGAKVGSIYWVLAPAMIVFLVPLFAALTRKVPTYTMLITGISVSTLSIFIAVIPLKYFSFLNDKWVSELIYDRWLNVPPENRTELYFALIGFTIVFTIGEALWSPRLMQFAAEAAPEGKEASYISLAVLPYFFAKFLAGPFSGILVSKYTPEALHLKGAPGIIAAPELYSDHYMVWLWIGIIALISPVGLVVLKKIKLI